MRILNKSIWPYQTRVNGNSDDMYVWCQEKLFHGGHYEPKWYYNLSTSTWCFKDEKEFLMFCLKWGS